MKLCLVVLVNRYVFYLFIKAHNSCNTVFTASKDFVQVCT